MLDDPPVPPVTSLFEQHAAQVIDRLKSALSAVIDSMPHLDGNRATDLADALGIDTKLAWKIGRILGSTDPFTAALYVPGANGFRVFLRAAKRRDLSKGVIASAQAAFDSFREMVHTHAGSRKAFDMMLAGHSKEDRARADIEHRRQMFEGSSYIWGAQARVAMRLDVVAPSADRQMFDCASIRGFIDLRRVRPDVPWRIARGYSVDSTGDPHTSFIREPLDPDRATTEPEGLPLLREFCSKPLPQCRRVDAPHGVTEYELVEGAVGNTGLVTCVTGEILRCAEPRYRTERYRDLAVMFRLRTPSEWVIFDLLVHRELFSHRIAPELVFYSDLFADRIAPRYRRCDRLPIQEEAEYLGTGPSVLATAEMPRHAKMAQAVLERCDWEGAEFAAYRVKMRYPPIPATLMITHELPEQPND